MARMSKRKRSRRPVGAGGGARQQTARRGRRDTDGAVWLYGRHAVLAAIRNKNREIQRLILTPAGRDAFEADLAEALTARAELAPAPAAETLAARDFERALPQGTVHQGIAALCRPLAEPGLEVLEAKPGGPLLKDVRPVLVLDQVTDPQNVGAVLRSAAVFGARAVVTTQRNAPDATGALAKAASGALDTVPYVHVTNLARALAEMRDMGFWVIGLDAGAEELLSKAKGTGPTALVLGAEGTGLRRLTVENCDAMARLPVAPGALAAGISSLNVSAAAAVALYELVRAG